jgi:hypothetical protein
MHDRPGTGRVFLKGNVNRPTAPAPASQIWNAAGSKSEQPACQVQFSPDINGPASRPIQWQESTQTSSSGTRQRFELNPVLRKSLNLAPYLKQKMRCMRLFSQQQRKCCCGGKLKAGHFRTHAYACSMPLVRASEQPVAFLRKMSHGKA